MTHPMTNPDQMTHCMKWLGTDKLFLGPMLTYCYDTHMYIGT